MTKEPTSLPLRDDTPLPHTIQTVRCPRCGAPLFHALPLRSVEVAARLFEREPEEFLRWLCQSKRRLDSLIEDNTPLDLCHGP